MRFVRPLITGTLAYSAISSSVASLEGADHDQVDIARQHPRAVSAMVSPCQAASPCPTAPWSARPSDARPDRRTASASRAFKDQRHHAVGQRLLGIRCAPGLAVPGVFIRRAASIMRPQIGLGGGVDVKKKLFICDGLSNGSGKRFARVAGEGQGPFPGRIQTNAMTVIGAGSERSPAPPVKSRPQPSSRPAARSSRATASAISASLMVRAAAGAGYCRRRRRSGYARHSRP